MATFQAESIDAALSHYIKHMSLTNGHQTNAKEHLRALCEALPADEADSASKDRIDMCKWLAVPANWGPTEIENALHLCNHNSDGVYKRAAGAKYSPIPT